MWNKSGSGVTTWTNIGGAFESNNGDIVQYQSIDAGVSSGGGGGASAGGGSGGFGAGNGDPIDVYNFMVNKMQQLGVTKIQYSVNDNGSVTFSYWKDYTETYTYLEDGAELIGITLGSKKMTETVFFGNDDNTWDKVTDKRISELDSRIQGLVTKFINESEKQGVKLRVTQGLRTIAEQNALYAQGRTTSGKKVTNAKGGQSYHNYGLAFDVVIMRDGKAVWEVLPNNIAKIATNLGFEWGGNWNSFKDYPHFQMTFGQSISQLQKK
jgi:hypothetical protein